MGSFSIIVDTGCDLPQEYLDEHNIKSVPIPFEIDGVQHDLGRWQGITYEEFYTKLRNGSIARTALFGPEIYREAFTEYAARNEDLIVVTLSSSISNSYQNSNIAISELKEEYPNCNIYVVDSLTAAAGCGFIVMTAVRKRAEGLSAGDVFEQLKDIPDRLFSLFTVNDLMYLHRGGRGSKLQAITGSVIGIKPILNVSPDGTLKVKDKARGRKAALEMLIMQMKRSLNAGTKHDLIIVTHAHCPEDGETLARMVRASVEVKQLEIVPMGPVIGAHSGPGTAAVFFIADMTRTEYENAFYDGKW